jgi:hypothetical protein
VRNTRLFSAAALVALGIAAALSPACKSEFDLTRLQGTWIEVDTGRAFRMDDQGQGFGPFCYSSPCRSTATIPYPLVVKVNVYDELFIQYGEGYPGSVGLIPCGPCVLIDDDTHLTCRQQTVDGGFTACEFDRLGGKPAADDTGVAPTPIDSAVSDGGAPTKEAGPVDATRDTFDGRPPG